MLIYIQCIIAVILGVVSTITDFKNKKIYNKNIIYVLMASLFIYIVLWKQITIQYITNYCINIIISVIISFSFYYFKIWSAGNAKLFLAIIIIIPYNIYNVEKTNLFPALYLLIIIFSIGFFYVVLETLVLWVKDKKRIQIFKLKIKNIKQIIINYFMGYFVILFINNITLKFVPDFRINNGGLMLICNMLILFFLYRIIKGKRKALIIMSLFLIANLTYYFIFGLRIYAINLKMFVFVLSIMLFRSFAEKYNYEEIRIENLKPRMILSFESVLKFYSSRVKGLPHSTDETTDSRLTTNEVNSIKRWSKTRKGQDTIIIVRHMPFAPFILIGEIIFFIFRLFI